MTTEQKTAVEFWCLEWGRKWGWLSVYETTKFELSLFEHCMNMLYYLPLGRNGQNIWK